MLFYRTTLIAVLSLVGTTCALAADALSVCDELRKQGEYKAAARCAADSFSQNYRPGFGSSHGQVLDEAEHQVTRCDKVCEGLDEGIKVMGCQC